MRVFPTDDVLLLLLLLLLLLNVRLDRGMLPVRVVTAHWCFLLGCDHIMIQAPNCEAPPSPTIVHTCCPGCALGDFGIFHIMDVLREDNHTLVSLSLRGATQSGGSFLGLGAAMASNRSLTYLDIRGDFVILHLTLL